MSAVCGGVNKFWPCTGGKGEGVGEDKPFKGKVEEVVMEDVDGVREWIGKWFDLLSFRNPPSHCFPGFPINFQFLRGVLIHAYSFWKRRAVFSGIINFRRKFSWDVDAPTIRSRKGERTHEEMGRPEPTHGEIANCERTCDWIFLGKGVERVVMMTW